MQIKSVPVMHVSSRKTILHLSTRWCLPSYISQDNYLKMSIVSELMFYPGVYKRLVYLFVYTIGAYTNLFIFMSLCQLGN